MVGTVSGAWESWPLFPRLMVAAAVVFGGLYVADSFGAPGMTLVAGLIALGVLLAQRKA